MNPQPASTIKPSTMLLQRNLFVFGVFLVFNLLSLTSNFSASHDSITYLNGLEESKELFHPHHLFYHISSYLVFKGLKVFLPFIENHYLIEAVNACWGAAMLLVVNLFLRNRFMTTPRYAFLATWLPAFSFGIWFYSANIEVYMPPLFFVILLLYKLTKEKFTSRDLTLVILLHAGAILFHQVNVLFTPVILLKIWQERKRISLGGSVLRYSLLGGGVVVFFYVLIMIVGLHLRSQEEMIAWIKGYSSESEYWFPLSIKTAINASIGFSHALLGAHFMFQVPFIRDYINSKFFYHSLNDELYLVKDISGQEAMLLFVLTMLFLVIFLICLIRSLAHVRELFKVRKTVMTSLLAAFSIYSIFFFFWMPENLEFCLLQVVLLWIFVPGSISRRKTMFGIKNWIWVGAMVALLFVINYFGSMRWLRDIDRDYFYVKIEQTKKEAKEKDLILLKDGWIVKEYLHRYVKAPVMFIPEPGNDSLRHAVDNRINATLSSGNKIFFYTDESFMHAIKNQPFIDSLLNANAGNVDTLHNELSDLKVIYRGAK